MKILLLEPYYDGSHKQWADELKKFSNHSIDIIGLPARFWKWRMEGSAITLANEYLKTQEGYDLILTTDMMNVATFIALIKNKRYCPPIAVYFHENQLTYPFSENDSDIKTGRDNHYAFINYTSALTADKVFFNSFYHRDIFITGLEGFLELFPDYNNIFTIDKIQEKSEVLPIGIDTIRLLKYKSKFPTIDNLILWNHRWEYDKNPDLFFKTLYRLKEENIDFNLAVMGKKYQKYPKVFDEAKEILKDRILHFGYCENDKDYIKLLWQSSIVPVTSNQDFFGISAVEAMFCNTMPILPKRLAFPEHLDQSWWDISYYTDDEEFYQKLKSALLNKTYKKMKYLDNYMYKYSWSHCKIQYDKAFENIILA